MNADIAIKTVTLESNIAAQCPKVSHGQSQIDAKLNIMRKYIKPRKFMKEGIVLQCRRDFVYCVDDSFTVAFHI